MFQALHYRPACPRRETLLALLLLLGLALVPAAARGEEKGEGAPAPDLGKRIEQLLAEAKIRGKIGIAVADARTGKAIFNHNADLPLNPASNVKLVTAAAALLELGADFCMHTGLYGQIEDNAIKGGLFIKGFGDPSLAFSDLVELARDLAARGVLSVDEVEVDGSYFDDQKLPPAFEQQPAETSAFRAAVGAVSVDRNSYLLRVRPGAAAGSPARVDLDVPGYFELDNKLTTGQQGPPSVVAIQRPGGDKLSLLLRGSVPAGSGMLSYRKRVADPLIYAGHAMVEALRAARISVPRRTSVAPTPVGTPLLASRCSPPLSEILSMLGKKSDNFTAEMLLKVLGAEKKRRPASSADGVTVALTSLKRLGVKTDTVKMVNGSGLFTGNLLAPSHFCQLLISIFNSPSIRPEYMAQLAIGGVDGTLSRRLLDLPATRVVRAKTGTVKGAIALSGYVLGPAPERAVAFSFIANGVGGHMGEARQLADRIVNAIARELWKQPQ